MLVLYVAEGAGFEPACDCSQTDFERPVGKESRGRSRSYKAFEYGPKSLHHAGLEAMKAGAARCSGIVRKEALLPQIREKMIEF